MKVTEREEKRRAANIMNRQFVHKVVSQQLCAFWEGFEKKRGQELSRVDNNHMIT